MVNRRTKKLNQNSAQMSINNGDGYLITNTGERITCYILGKVFTNEPGYKIIVGNSIMNVPVDKVVPA